jgi:hypothetical protein
MHNLSVHDNSGSHAIANRDENKVVFSACRSAAALSQGRQVGVVFDRYEAVKVLAKQGC